MGGWSFFGGGQEGELKSFYVVDQSVCIWDIRRPYVPFTVFEEHNDVVSCMVQLWRSDRDGV